MSHPIDEFTLTSKRTPAARGRLHKGILLGSLLVATALMMVRAYFPWVLVHPLPIIAGPHGLKIYVHPLEGWSLAFPGAWHHETRTLVGGYRSYLGSTYISITNIEHPFSETFDGSGMDSRLVAIRIGSSSPGRHFSVWCKIDTRLPLSLKGTSERRRHPLLDDSGGRIVHLHKTFSKAGRPYGWVGVWIGSQASSADIETMEAIVGSLNYTPSGDPKNGTADCSNGVPAF